MRSPGPVVWDLSALFGSGRGDDGGYGRVRFTAGRTEDLAAVCAVSGSQGGAREALRPAEGTQPHTEGAGPLNSRTLLPVAAGVVALAALVGGWSIWRAANSGGTARVAYLTAGAAALVAVAGLATAVQQRRETRRRARALAVRLERANLDAKTDLSALPNRELLLREARELRDRLTDAGDLEEAAVLDRAISDEPKAAQP